MNARENIVYWAVRCLVFVTVTVSLVGGYCYAVGRALPPLRNEPPSLLLLPMTVISGLVSLFLYPTLRRRRRRSSRVLAMYLGFLLSAALYGGYLWFFIPDGTPWLILLALIAGHLYGLPVFLAVVTAHLLMSRLIFPEVDNSSH